MLSAFARYVLVLSAIVGNVCSQPARAADPNPSLLSPGAQSTVAPFQDLKRNVRFYRLENGLRVIMYKRGTAPVFAGLVAVRVGGVDELPGHTGISHMLEHMAFKGTPTIGTKNYEKERDLLQQLEKIQLTEVQKGKLSDEEQGKRNKIYSDLQELWTVGDFSIQYDRRGATDMNATTSKEITNYFVNFPRAAFEFWCWAESERLLFPVMRQFYQERDVVMEERRMRSEDDPGGKLYEMMLGIAYLKHPYRNPIIGYEDDLKRLTATETANFHGQYYVAENIVVSLVGDVDYDRDIKTINEYFGRLPSRPVPGRTHLKENPAVGERTVVLNRKASPVLYIAYPKPNYPDPDDAPISLMGEVLVGSKVSPLYDDLVKRKRMASSVDYGEEPGVSFPNLMLFSITPNQPHSNEQVLAEFDKVVERFKRDGPSEDELQIAKRSVAMQYLEHLKSNLSLAKDFAASELLFSNWQASFDWYEQAMRVSVDDIMRVSGKYLQSSRRVVAMVKKSDLPEQ